MNSPGDLSSKQGRYYNSGYCATACGYIVRERGVESWPATFACSEHADRFVAMMNGDAEPPSAWQPIETAPHDREVLFWVVPLSADETYRDTSGNPITSGEKPRMMFCRFGRWSSLSKAIYWADVPGSPTVTKSEEPEPEHVCDGGWACHFHDVKKAVDETNGGRS